MLIGQCIRRIGIGPVFMDVQWREWRLERILFRTVESERGVRQFAWRQLLYRAILQPLRSGRGVGCIRIGALFMDVRRIERRLDRQLFGNPKGRRGMRNGERGRR